MSSLEKQARTNVGKKLIELIEANPDKDWDWYEISRNRNLTMEMIEANPDKPWDWEGISMNSNLTMEFIEANPDKRWDCGEFGISINSFEEEYKKELERLKIRKQLIHNRYAFRKQIGLRM